MTDSKGGQGTEPAANEEMPLAALDDIVGGTLADAEVEVDEVPVKW